MEKLPPLKEVLKNLKKIDFEAGKIEVELIEGMKE